MPMLQDCSWAEETGMLSFNFFLRSSEIATYFLEFMWTLFPPSWKLTDSTLHQSQNRVLKIFFCRTVEMKFFWHWLTFFVPNSSVFFLCQFDVKNLWFITCDNAQNHGQITCVLREKFLDCVDSHSFIPVSQLFGCLSYTHFSVTVSGKNTLYGHVGNFNIVFSYPQIPNFKNHEALVIFENCEHHMSHFICWNVAPLTTCFIVVNVFPFLLMESVRTNLRCI